MRVAVVIFRTLESFFLLTYLRTYFLEHVSEGIIVLEHSTTGSGWVRLGQNFRPNFSSVRVLIASCVSAHIKLLPAVR